ncbi:MAG TPA: putative phage abortive infection protein [Gemmataceae bacterium]|nr:putative phage abortive infection protein [Gemmataceae bacterium]
MAEAERGSGLAVLTARRVLLMCTAVVFVSWLVVFVVGWTTWDPDRGTKARGDFGSSFGTLSALFAGLAFVGVTTAAVLQWEQLKEHRRELQEMTTADYTRAVEGRFFHLLSTLQTAVNETRLATKGGGMAGRQAVKRIADHLVRDFAGERKRRSAGPELSLEDRRADIDDWYGRFHAGEYEAGRMHGARFGDIVAHLCRLTCHVLRFVDESCVPQKDKEFYARILRAHLSGPELVLLFYNCLSRHGYPEHYSLADRYELFRDMDRDPLVSPYDVLLYKCLERFAPPPGTAVDPRDGGEDSNSPRATGRRSPECEARV